MRILLLTIVILTTAPVYAFVDLRGELNEQTRSGQKSLSYDQARVKLFNEIYLERDSKGYFVRDVYCLEKYYMYLPSETPMGHLPDPKYMNTEHTWPQSLFNEDLSANIQKTDLHHLYPTFSRINADRGSLPFAEVNSIRKVSCDKSAVGTPISSGKGTFFEPPDSHKGNLARSLFYFAVRYEMTIDPVEEFYLRQWHVLDPVDANETKRHEMIFNIQKNRNPFIDHPELVNQILDF